MKQINNRSDRQINGLIFTYILKLTRYLTVYDDPYAIINLFSCLLNL